VREYACTTVDILARRLRLSFLNVQVKDYKRKYCKKIARFSKRGAKIYQEFMSLKAAEEALPKIVAIMADELGWDDKEKLRQSDLAIQFLRSVNPFFIAVGVTQCCGSGLLESGVFRCRPKYFQ
jgi:glycerol-3-phosphate dehydrogenase